MTERNPKADGSISQTTVFQQAAGECLADRIEALAMEVREINGAAPSGAASIATLAALAAALSETRRRIDEIYELKGFAVSPACDIVLELFQARARGGPINMERLLAALSCPSSVAIRWTAALQEMRLVELFGGGAPDRTMVALTEKGFIKTAQVLAMHLQD